MKAKSIAILLMTLIPFQAIGQESKVSEEFDQQKFAEAYNRKDADAMAMAFSERGIRITPSGIFRGRDEIRRSFQDALKLGLHEYSVR